MNVLAIALTLFASFAAAEGAPWPTLPTKFVSGRLATQQDLASGNAVFRMDIEGKQITKPTRQFQIPQFAYLRQDNGNRRPVVVVQVELLQDEPVFGMRDADGEMYIASAEDVELLGLSHP